MRVFGIELVGVTAESGQKLLLTILFVILVMGISRGLRWFASQTERGEKSRRIVFLTRQDISLVTAAILVLGLLYLVRRSQSFGDHARLVFSGASDRIVACRDRLRRLLDHFARPNLLGW
jgi:hypothetical protein